MQHLPALADNSFSTQVKIVEMYRPFTMILLAAQVIRYRSLVFRYNRIVCPRLTGRRARAHASVDKLIKLVERTRFCVR